MGDCYISQIEEEWKFDRCRWKNGTRTTGLQELWHRTMVVEVKVFYRDTRCCSNVAMEFYKHPLEKYIYIYI